MIYVIRYHYGPFISLLIETESGVRRCPRSAIPLLHQTLAHSVQKGPAVHLGVPSAVCLHQCVKYTTLQAPSWESFNACIFIYCPECTHEVSGQSNPYSLLNNNNCTHSSCPLSSSFWGDAMWASQAQREVPNHRGGTLKIYIWECICILFPVLQREGEKPHFFKVYAFLWGKQGENSRISTPWNLNNYL